MRIKGGMLVMKKFLCALVMVLVFSAAVFAKDSHKVGMVERLNVTPQEFNKMLTTAVHAVILANNPAKPEFFFYRSMNQMIMALNAGEIDEILMPEAVAEYFLNTNPDYTINCIVMTPKDPYLLSFGFNSDHKELCESFDKTIAEMKRDGTLITLQGKYILGVDTAVMEERYITNPDLQNIPPVMFRKFPGAPEIKAAVTGDMPPIDYIAADGSAEGFNAAILAEIAGRLGLNVRLQNIESGARAAMLSSGRSDVVFWFEHKRNGSTNHDVPEGVILSEPYYQFDTFYHLKPAK